MTNFREDNFFYDGFKHNGSKIVGMKLTVNSKGQQQITFVIDTAIKLKSYNIAIEVEIIFVNDNTENLYLKLKYVMVDLEGRIYPMLNRYKHYLESVDDRRKRKLKKAIKDIFNDLRTLLSEKLKQDTSIKMFKNSLLDKKYIYAKSVRFIKDHQLKEQALYYWLDNCLELNVSKEENAFFFKESFLNKIYSDDQNEILELMEKTPESDWQDHFELYFGV
jgi:hypothetical protein